MESRIQCSGIFITVLDDQLIDTNNTVDRKAVHITICLGQVCCALR